MAIAVGLGDIIGVIPIIQDGVIRGIRVITVGVTLITDMDIMTTGTILGIPAIMVGAIIRMMLIMVLVTMDGILTITEGITHHTVATILITTKQIVVL